MEKYIVFPPGVDSSTLLGKRGVGVGWGVKEEVKEMGDDNDEGGEGEGSRGTDVSMRQVQSQVDNNMHIVHGERVEHYEMDNNGPPPGEDVSFDEDEDEEEEMHRPVVKSKLNNALLSEKKVTATSSPSKPPSANG